jgi:RNase H-fold protein (predicted Holliday junction resolvase)
VSRVLGIDPGTRKAGFAIVEGASGTVVDLGIEPVEALLARAKALVEAHAVVTIALGEGTNATALRAALVSLGVPVRLVDERETTLRARSLYFADHPPRGWRKLIPLGMQVPPRPIDDYAAVLIARRYLADAGELPNLV